MFKLNLKKCQLKRKLELEKEISKKEKELNTLKNRLQFLNNSINQPCQ